MPRDRIRVSGLRVDCIIGVLDHERERQQPVRVDIDMALDTRESALSGRIDATCDYSVVANEVSAMLRFRRYRLLEMAADELCAAILGVHPQVHALELTIHKPHAIAQANDVAVSIQRDPGDYPRRYERNNFGEVEILHENREAGLYLLHIDAGKSIPPHFHRVMRELEWLVDGEVTRDGRLLRGQEPVMWPKERVHTYENVGSSRATLFCCDCPPFIPSDEVVVST